MKATYYIAILALPLAIALEVIAQPVFVNGPYYHVRPQDLGVYIGAGVSISDLGSGLYLIRIIYTNGQSEISKIIKTD